MMQSFRTWVRCASFQLGQRVCSDWCSDSYCFDWGCLGRAWLQPRRMSLPQWRALAPEVPGPIHTRREPTNMDTLLTSRTNAFELDSAECTRHAANNRPHRECDDRKNPSAKLPYSIPTLSSPDTKNRP